MRNHSIAAAWAAAMFGQWGDVVAAAAERAMEMPPMLPISGPYGSGRRDLRRRTSKYMPHQNAREKARRVRQMAAGQLQFHSNGA